MKVDVFWCLRRTHIPAAQLMYINGKVSPSPWVPLVSAILDSLKGASRIWVKMMTFNFIESIIG
jgi:hypothetical protein